MSEEEKSRPGVSGVLAALESPPEVLAEAAVDPAHLERLCWIVDDDDGPGVERHGTVLALAGLLTSESRLKKRLAGMLEDARAFGALSRPRGATFYECRCVRALLLALLATCDGEAAARIAAEREILWPDEKVWTQALPSTPGAVFVAISQSHDELKVADLGLAWLGSGVVPAALAPKVRPLLDLLVEAGEAKREEEATRATAQRPV